MGCAKSPGCAECAKNLESKKLSDKEVLEGGAREGEREGERENERMRE